MTDLKSSLQKLSLLLKEDVGILFNSDISEKYDENFSFKDMENAFPLICAFFGKRISSFRQLRSALNKISLLQDKVTNSDKKIKESEYIRRLGLVILFYEEIKIYFDALSKRRNLESILFSDTHIRKLGIALLDKSISGFIVFVGSVNKSSSRDVFLTDAAKRKLIVFDDAYKTVQCLIRLSFMFGCQNKKDWKSVCDYCRSSLPAVTVLLDNFKEIDLAQACGALNLSVPIITNKRSLKVRYSKIKNGYDAFINIKESAVIIDKVVEARNIKFVPDLSRFPVGFGTKFEGQIIKDKDSFIDFSLGSACELLVNRNPSQIRDGQIEIIGSDLDSLKADGYNKRLFILVEMVTKSASNEFNAVLERQIHRFINYIDGVTHSGQSDFLNISVSRSSFRKGLRLNDIAFFIYAMMHREYSKIINKIQIKIITDRKRFEKELRKSRDIHRTRLVKVINETDESVKEFYSCSICRSFALNHICIISPEHPGLCGSYSFLDAKIAFEIEPSGANYPIKKGKVIDRRLGQWQGVNRYIKKVTKNAVKKVNLYSLIEYPHTCSLCFECIVVILPELNGVMVVSRDYTGKNPLGLDFSKLAHLLGFGVQSPGMLGSSRVFLLSKKFMPQEGGVKRIIWMPSSLKYFLTKYNKASQKKSNLKKIFSKIADEHDCTCLEDLAEFLKKRKHSCLNMSRII
ncbi:MAG: hypothetical protein P9L96_06075 [Candidatus Gygaella obscura]|nr:hypothetical protein [Candidatus Gygaella obscura]